MANINPDFLAALAVAQRGALAHLNNLDSDSVGPTADLDSLRRQLDKPFTDEGMSATQVITELVRDVSGGLQGSAGGRFFGWVIGGSQPAALAADWLTAAWDQNSALYTCSPAAAVVEEITGKWLIDVLGLPRTASFAFVTGCQMAHATCLAAARHAVLAREGWDVEQQGLFGAPRIRILSSRQRHASFERAVRLLGFGLEQVVYLPTNSHDQLPYEVLEEALQADQAAPTIVLLQAGDINIGAFDTFRTLIPLAKRYQAWVHVDGAFGLWAAASARYRHLLAGVALADSWATDGHKWLNVPFDCGYAFVADPEAHSASMSQRAAYLTHVAQARDQIDWNPEWSRRARGFATYAVLRQLGRHGVADLVERCCHHAHALVMGIGSLPGVEVLWEPVINQGLVRFLDSKPAANEDDHDRRTDEVIAAIVATGEAFFGGTTWQGRRAMRVSVCNWQTSETDVERVIAAINNVLRRPVLAN